MKKLYLLVEGNDDERFFDKIVKPKLKSNYNSVNIWKHANRKDKVINNFIKTINDLNNDYYYFEDLGENETSLNRRISNITRRIQTLDNNKIYLVIKEIEGWYLAGLTTKVCSKMNFKKYDHTNNITKSDYKEIISENNYGSNTSTMIEILKHYKLNTGFTKNNSLKYFFDNI